MTNSIPDFVSARAAEMIYVYTAIRLRMHMLTQLEHAPSACDRGVSCGWRPVSLGAERDLREGSAVVEKMGA
jgi:hypothetical protein